MTADMAASCRFYALLGVPVGEPPEGDDHFEATLPSGIRLMWDSVELVKQIDPDWQPPVGHRLGLAFHCGRRPGWTARTPRCRRRLRLEERPLGRLLGPALREVIDPDGNEVDLFAPLDG